jgi:serine/threonine protein kinase
MEPFSFLASAGFTPFLRVTAAAWGLWIDCQYRIRRSFGCIAEAVTYLHEQGIRHKDLKPSQILLSPRGLWLTGFGWSTDMSEFSHSATSGGDNITAKYRTPERSRHEACGRAEDVFALGCIFLELSYAMLSPRDPFHISGPWSRKGWSFCDNLEQTQKWLKPLYKDPYDHPFKKLAKIIAVMLAFTDLGRPSIQQVVEQLRSIEEGDQGEYFTDDCCLQSSVRAQPPTDQYHRHRTHQMMRYVIGVMGTDYSPNRPLNTTERSKQSEEKATEAHEREHVGIAIRQQQETLSYYNPYGRQ